MRRRWPTQASATTSPVTTRNRADGTTPSRLARGSAAWSDLLDDLVTFALHQLRHEVRTGTIVRWCAVHFQRPMGPLPHDWGSQDREDIVHDAITAALEKMISDIDAGKGWDPTRGSSLAAYFLDLCTGTFPNCVQAWRTGHRQAVHVDVRVEAERS